MLGTIKWIGDRGIADNPVAKSKFRSITDKAALATFATWIKTNVTDCNITYYAVSDETRPNESRPGVDANVDVLAVIVVQESTGSVRKHSIPAPMAAIIEAKDQGDRISQTIVDGFATAYGVATGLSFTGLYGYVTQKK